MTNYWAEFKLADSSRHFASDWSESDDLYQRSSRSLIIEEVNLRNSSVHATQSCITAK